MKSSDINIQSDVINVISWGPNYYVGRPRFTYTTNYSLSPPPTAENNVIIWEIESGAYTTLQDANDALDWYNNTIGISSDRNLSRKKVVQRYGNFENLYFVVEPVRVWKYYPESISTLIVNIIAGPYDTSNDAQNVADYCNGYGVQTVPVKLGYLITPHGDSTLIYNVVAPGQFAMEDDILNPEAVSLVSKIIRGPYDTLNEAETVLLTLQTRTPQFDGETDVLIG